MKVKSTSAKIGDWVFVLICVLISIICVVPMINLLAKSLSSTDYLVKNAVVVHSLEMLLTELKQYRSEDVYIVGGESVYRQMLPYCDVAHITKMNRVYEADCYFPNLDRMPEWKVIQDSDEQTYFDLEYTFFKYERCNEPLSLEKMQ